MKNSPPKITRKADDFLISGGEMGECIRAFDWSKTALGSVETWSPALRMMTSFLLVNRFPLLLWWGPHYVSIYNDAYIPVLGTKHPWALGQPVSECWKEIWHILQPLIDTPFTGGPATWNDDISLEINRHGFVEETHFTIAYSPVPDETVPSGIGGVLATVHEITEKVIGERRVAALCDLGTQSAEAETAEEACRITATVLAGHEKDVPFALLYLIDADGRRAQLAGSTGVARDEPGCPPVLDLGDGDESPWPVAALLRTETTQVIDNLGDLFGAAVLHSPWSHPPREAVLVPIRSNMAHQLAGMLVAGVSARLKLDELYRNFYELMAGQIATAIANARAYEEEKRRAEALAEIDRTKTAFFSNVSHEFRTPLTLMLGPVEELLGKSHTELSPSTKGQLELVNRNGLRLLRLVNSLLDFSRIEVGRMQARYEATNLGAFTAELASCFRSATERAGLQLIVDCPPLSEPIYVDRDMWEKIVLNLLSNAFKFTFEGEIEVSLRIEDSGLGTESSAQTRGVVLRVRDTGVGIPTEAMPHLFERFYRGDNTRSRTHEGSGIGLALVQELVKLHGGSVRAESAIGQGSTFIVTVPTGTAHLPTDRIGPPRRHVSPATCVTPFVEEALRWLPDSDQGEVDGGEKPSEDEPLPTAHPPFSTPSRILVVDDNADMRQYVARVLAERYCIETAADGEAALQAIRTRRPDLVLSDVMMPKLDGFGLLRTLRTQDETRTIPVIFLSARAGEESRIEGLEQAADDYLIKPFSARELLARVQAHLDMARIRREAEQARLHVQDELQLIFDSAPVMIWYKDTENRIVRVNRMAADSIKLPKGHIEGRAVADFYPEEADRYYQDDLIVIQTGQPRLGIVEPYRLPGGELRWVQTDKVPMMDESGRVVGILVLSQDITEHKQAEERLRRSEQHLELISNNVPALISYVDRDFRYRTCNDAYTQWFGLPRNHIIGKPVREVLGEEAWTAVGPRMEEAFSGRTVEYEAEARYQHGDTRWIHAVYTPDRNALGEVVGIVVMVTDLTVWKQTEEKLRESEERLRSILNRAPAAIFIKDPAGRYLFMNEQCARVLSVDREQALGHTDRDLLAPELAAQFMANDQRVWKSGRLLTVEERVPQADGVYISLVQKFLLRDSQGRPYALSGIALDITPYLQLEAAIQASEVRLQLAQSAANIGVFDWDIAAQKGVWSSELERIWGLPVGAFDGTVEAWRRLVHPDDQTSAQAGLLRSLEDPTTASEFEYRIVRPDGAMRWIYAKTKTLCDTEGQAVRMVGINLDITDRKEAQLRLERSAEELERQVASRTQELVSSQERLRTLTSELNLAEQRERKRLATELHDHLQQMLVLGKLTIGQGKRAASGVPACESALKKVDDILSEALTYSRTLVAELSPPVLHDHGLVAGLKWLAEYMKNKHEHTVTVVVFDDQGLKLPDDQVILLFQSVRELLINSAKHAGTGQAALTMEQQDGNLCITVSDEGKGFDLAAAAAGIPSSGISSKYGLLSIQERMRAIGGSFNIHSFPGQGTTTTLILPLARSTEDSVLSPPLTRRGNVRAAAHAHGVVALTKQRMMVQVLLVDDHAMVRQGLRSVLDAYEDIQVVGEAKDGLEAVRLVEELRPRVVVMDINMPKMNGIEATNQIKTQWPETTVIGISVNLGDDNAAAMQRAGAAALVTKEAAVDQLYDAIQESVKKRV